MEQAKKKAKIMLCVAIALMLVSMCIASAIQSNGGKVTIKELYWETDFGIRLSANLYVPNTATPDNPAPAIVASHGAFNNKEMQDANCIELSRRGYVVLAIDQPGHGKSDLAGTNGLSFPGNSGVYQGVLLVSRLPYVDLSRIGVTGHSMGGMSCTGAVNSDNAAESQLISAVLLNSADATYVDSTSTGLSDTTSDDFANIYGNRDVGIISCVYDEFFHKSEGAGGNQLPSPYFMESANAQSFLNFGVDPEGLDKRVSDTMYRETIDGKDSIRIIYRPHIIHPWSHFSALSTRFTIEFFEETLGAPNPINSSSQVWNVKEAFNFVGLAGFALFITYFSILMMFTPYFSVLRAEEVIKPAEVDKKGKLWFWGTLSAASLFAMITYLPVVTKTITASVKLTQPFAIGCWAMGCGLFTILCMFLFYKFYGKSHGFDLAERGVKISLDKLAKTVLLAIIVVCVSYGCVFFAHYFFMTDFRIWTLAIKAFNSNQIFITLFPYLFLYMVFYVAVSVSANCFNYNQIGGKRSWGNILIISLLVASPAVIMLAIQYGTYFATDHLAWAQVSFAGGNPPMYILWFFPLLLILPVSTFISRSIYKVSRNPYLAGIISSIIVALFACTNTRG